MRKIILLFLLLCGGLLNAQISLSEIQDTVGKGYVPITDYDPALATYIQKYMLLQDYLRDSIDWNIGTLDLYQVLSNGNDAGGLEALNFSEVESDEFIGDLRGAVLFKAQAGEALSKGDVVYVSGISGNTTIVSKADADDAAKMPAFGVVAASASLNNPVDIYTFGTLSNLNTSAYTLGDVLYVSTTAGQLTATAPTGESALLQNIAKVTRVDNSAGSIKISGAGRTNATPNLNTGRLFVGNASNQAVADGTMYVDIANGRVGIGTSSPDKSLVVSGAGTEIVINDTSNAPILRFRNSGATSGTVEMTNTQDMRFRTGGTSEAMRITSAGDLGIGTTSPLDKLHVNGSIRVQNSNALLRRYLSGWVEPLHDVVYSGFTTAGDNYNDYVYLKAPSSAGTTHGVIVIGDDAFAIGNTSVETGAISSLDQGYKLFGNSTGIGIGTNSPAYKLDVAGDMQISSTLPRFHMTDTNSPDVTIQNANGTSFQVIVDGGVDFEVNADGSIYAALIATDNTTENVLVQSGNIIRQRTMTSLIEDAGYWDRNSGSGYLYPSTLTDRVGIGTSLPIGNLTVKAENRVITIGDSGRTNWASIKATNTAGTGAAYLEIDTYGTQYMQSGTLAYYHKPLHGGIGLYDVTGATEDVRISATTDSWFNGGNLGIGTVSPTTELQVNGGVYGNGLLVSEANNTDMSNLAGSWLQISHDTYNGAIGNQYPNPECGILMHNEASNNEHFWSFYQGVVKDVASTSPNSSFRYDIGNALYTQNISGTRTFTPLMTVRWTGNTGIGLTNPLERFVVSGGNMQLSGNTYTDFTDFWSGSGGDNSAIFTPYGFLGSSGAFAVSLYSNGYRNDTAGFTYIGTNGNTSTASGIDLMPTGDIYFRNGTAIGTNLPIRMTIKNGGNTGIGTNSPSVRLHAKSSTLGTLINDELAVARFEVSGGNRINLDYSAKRLAAGSNWNNTEQKLSFNIDENASKDVWIKSINGTSITDNVLAFGEGASEEWMRIDNGSVGIGTQLPAKQVEIENTGADATMLIETTDDYNAYIEYQNNAGGGGLNYRTGVTTLEHWDISSSGQTMLRLDRANNRVQVIQQELRVSSTGSDHVFFNTDNWGIRDQFANLVLYFDATPSNPLGTSMTTYNNDLYWVFDSSTDDYQLRTGSYDNLKYEKTTGTIGEYFELGFDELKVYSETDFFTLTKVDHTGGFPETASYEFTDGGYIRTSTGIEHKADTNTKMVFADDFIRFDAGGYDLLHLEERAGLVNRVVINQNSTACEFRVESDTDANAIFMNGTSGDIGFGTNTPSAKLDIVTTDGTTALEVNGSTTGSNIAAHIKGGNGGSTTALIVDGDNETGDVLMKLRSNNTATPTDSDIKMIVQGGGNVGINESSPSAKLDVVGDTELNGEVTWSLEALAQLYSSATTNEVGGGGETIVNFNFTGIVNSGSTIAASTATELITVTNTAVYEVSFGCEIECTGATETIDVYLKINGSRIANYPEITHTGDKKMTYHRSWAQNITAGHTVGLYGLTAGTGDCDIRNPSLQVERKY